MKGRTSSFLHLLAPLTVLLIAPCANAAHWEVVTQTDSNYPNSPVITGNMTRGTRSQQTFTVPSGYTHGVGTFTFFGEGDSAYRTESFFSSPRNWHWDEY